MADVLVVDDSSFMRLKVSRLVRELGHEVRLAAHGAEALSACRTRAPDCVLTDLLMPEMSGLEFLEQLRADAALRPLPVVVLTADIQENTRQRCEELGVVAFLNKPPKHDDLRSALEVLSRRAEAPGA